MEPLIVEVEFDDRKADGYWGLQLFMLLLLEGRLLSLVGRPCRVLKGSGDESKGCADGGDGGGDDNIGCAFMLLRRLS